MQHTTSDAEIACAPGGKEMAVRCGYVTVGFTNCLGCSRLSCRCELVCKYRFYALDDPTDCRNRSKCLCFIYDAGFGAVGKDHTSRLPTSCRGGRGWNLYQGVKIASERALRTKQQQSRLGFNCIMPGQRLNLSHRVGETSSAVPADRDWRLRINCKAEWPPEPASSLVQV